MGVYFDFPSIRYYNPFIRRHIMARATKEEAQSPERKGHKWRKWRKQDDEQDEGPPTIEGIPIPEFLWDAPDHYHIVGA